MRVEVRATRLRSLREARALTQRRLAHDLRISQNYVPAIEAGARRADTKLQAQMVRYFGVPFEAIFDVVLVDPETKRERPLQPRSVS